MAAKIERRAELDAEIPALEAEIAEAKTKRSAELDAEIAALMVEIAAAKSNRINKLAAMDAEIPALEAQLAAHRAWLWTNPNLFPHFYKLELIKREKFKPILHKFVYHFLV
jgi:uncharacterized small protein (DUF1192 family)